MEHEDPRAVRSRAAALGAAQDLLFERGWPGVTHAAVSDRCGVGRSTLYRHWPEVSDLVRDLLVDGVCLEHSTPSGDVRSDLVAELELLRRQLGVARMRQVVAAVVERAQNDPAFSGLPRALHESGAGVLRGILEGARERGELRDNLDLRQGVAELLGPMFFLAVIMGEPPKRELVVSLVDDFLRAHTRAHGDASQPPPACASGHRSRADSWPTPERVAGTEAHQRDGCRPARSRGRPKLGGPAQIRSSPAPPGGAARSASATGRRAQRELAGTSGAGEGAPTGLLGAGRRALTAPSATRAAATRTRPATKNASANPWVMAAAARWTRARSWEASPW